MKINKYQKSILFSDAKKNFSCLYKQAEAGVEIKVEKEGISNVSLINTNILTVILNDLVIPIEEIPDRNIKWFTIIVLNLPLYGEGKTREQAIENLINAIIEFCEIYLENLDIYKSSLSPYSQAIMLKLLRCNNDRKMIRAALKI